MLNSKQWFLTSFLLLLTVVTTSPLFAQEIIAEVDRNQVNTGETFRVIFSVDSQANDLNPNLSPLEKDFTVIGTSRSAQMRIINGKASASKQWIVTLAPKSAGKLTIPAISFGKIKSEPLTIAVGNTNQTRDAKQSRNVFIETDISTKKPYIQSQVTYTVRLFYAINLNNGTLTDPSANDAVIMPLGKDRNYQTRRASRLYRVVERSYAIFPQKSGTLVITAPMFKGSTDISSSHFNNVNPLFSLSGQPIQLSAAQTTLNVRAIPKSYTYKNWLPAESVTVDSTWSKDPSEAQVGDPLTRTITIAATGLTAEQLPVTHSAPMAGVNIYPDKGVTKNIVKNNKLIGKRVEKTAYIPSQAGKINLPEIKIPWWNTKKNRLVVITIPAKTIAVSPATGASQTATTATPAATINNPQATETIKPITTSPSHWQWLTIGLLSAWLITLLAWWYYARSRKTKTIKANSQQKPISRKEIYAALKQACSKQQPQQVKQQLLNWAKQQWSVNPPLNLRELAKQVDNQNLATHINHLDKILYADEKTNWQSHELWQAFVKYQKQKQPKKDKNKKNLPELHLT